MCIVKLTVSQKLLLLVLLLLLKTNFEIHAYKAMWRQTEGTSAMGQAWGIENVPIVKLPVLLLLENLCFFTCDL